MADKSSSKFRVFDVDSRPTGWVGLTNFELRHKSCEWGGYLAPDAPRGNGLGRAMLYLSLELAFGSTDLNRVVVEALSFNQRAIRLYESVGFVREALLREYAHLNSGVFDVIGLSILRGEWHERRAIEYSKIKSAGLFN